VPLNDIPADGEDPHCWREFQPAFTLADLIAADPLFAPQTKNPAPHYRMVTDVTTFGFNRVDIAAIVRDSATKAAHALDRVAGECDVWFEMEENLPTNLAQLIGKEMPKFRVVLEGVLATSDSVNKRIERLKKIDPIQAKIIAQDLVPHADRVLKVLRRACKEIPGMTTFANEDWPKSHGILKVFAKAM
jgi:hypothetical protein